VSTENIYAATLKVIQAHKGGAPIQSHLDVGSGQGRLIELVHNHFHTESSACDYTEKLMKLPGQKVDVANLNSQPLPYPDHRFDLVTATEIIEHLEHYREALREFFRVLKPGGLCVLSTPNVLNLNSRLRYLWFGFPNLFGPLPVKNSALYSTGGHINPVTYFHVAHSMLDAGFENVAFTPDKFQRSSIGKALFWGLPIKFFGALAWRREVKRYHTIDEQNAPFVATMNSWPMLFSRTILVAGTKRP
jgi:ubiquinone/menaquinone biosynthesis C-methylase UbiE